MKKLILFVLFISLSFVDISSAALGSDNISGDSSRLGFVYLDNDGKMNLIRETPDSAVKPEYDYGVYGPAIRIVLRMFTIDLIGYSDIFNYSTYSRYGSNKKEPLPSEKEVKRVWGIIRPDVMEYTLHMAFLEKINAVNNDGLKTKAFDLRDGDLWVVKEDGTLGYVSKNRIREQLIAGSNETYDSQLLSFLAGFQDPELENVFTDLEKTLYGKKADGTIYLVYSFSNAYFPAEGILPAPDSSTINRDLLDALDEIWVPGSQGKHKGQQVD